MRRLGLGRGGLHEGAGPLGRAVCSFEVDLFNEGALATGLRGPSVAFDGADGDRVAVARLKDAVSKQDLWALDLPSRSWTHASVYALLEEEVQDALSFRRVHLVGEFPDGNNFETKMVERRTTSPPARGPPTPARTMSPVATFAPAFSSGKGPPGSADEAKAALASEASYLEVEGVRVLVGKRDVERSRTEKACRSTPGGSSL